MRDDLIPSAGTAPPRLLKDLDQGAEAYIRGIRTNGLLRRRLLDLGFVPGAKVASVMRSPAGDPTVYRIRQTQIALRNIDAGNIEIAADPGPGNGNGHSLRAALKTPLGEEQRPCPSGGCPACSTMPRFWGNEGTPFKIALAGNPNTGKSTVFNALTGLHQHVGNWPGKTVTRAEGFWNFKDDRFQVIDLPGTYSLLSTSTDEEIARDYILFGAPDCTVIVADAVCLERNLNIAFQIMEITDRVVLCVNLIDEARRKGIRIDREVLEAQLGVPVVLTAARSGVGLAALKERVFEVATRRVQPKPVRVPYEPQLQAAIDEILPRIERAFPDLPNARWIAMRLIDGGDQRLRQEIESGVLADLSGRIGEESLELSVRPDKTEIGR